MNNSADTIAAIATAPGRGGVGIIRISGSQAKQIAQHLVGTLPPERYARHTRFLDPKTGQFLDDGLVIVFTGPHSYTGEDVVELQGHGGTIVLDLILQACLTLGARLARPGEFTERAFLNGRMDLTQAEAVADLIDAGNTAAVNAAQRTRQGQFGKQINDIIQALIQLRVYIESALDFAEEEIDFLSDQNLIDQIQTLLESIKSLNTNATQGVLLREGITLAIVGEPNAGKSSLLNQLTGEELAIVTAHAGTTRDVLRAAIQIDGIPLHLIDTAGIRESQDPIEQEGIRRAQKEMQQAHAILWIKDDQEEKNITLNFPEKTPVIQVTNKIDLTNKNPGLNKKKNQYAISAKTGAGIDELKQAIKRIAGLTDQEDGHIMARRRHLADMATAQNEIENALTVLKQQQAGELCAESLRRAQRALERITGRYTSDDLLGEIFSQFCIGK